MVGVALSIRAKEDVLSVWLRDSSNALAKIKLGYVYAPRKRTGMPRRGWA